MENQRDEKLWKIAEQRAKFKRHAANYVAVNIFLWLVWWFTGKHTTSFIPWPAWVTIGWGFGIFMHYMRVYHSDMEQDTEKEYKKLLNRDK